MDESWKKKLFIRLVFFACVIAMPVAGVFHAPAWLAAFPAATVLAGITVEMRRLMLLHRRYKVRSSPERHGRRLSLFRPVTTYDLVIHRYTTPVPTLARGRIRIAHVSDFHVHPSVRPDYFRRVMDEINAQEPDLLFITGDFVMGKRNIPLLPPVMELAKPRVAAFGCLGNHDHWMDSSVLISALESSRLRMLVNKNQRVSIPGAGTVIVSGCNDPWTGCLWTPPARDPGEILLVLSHTADNIYRLNRANATAVFSGHYHSGHFSFPLFGPLIIPSRYGRLFHHGHFRVDNTHLFVTAGIGAAFPPIRIYCQPEIQIVDFVPEK
jgi:hypothetical protein